MVAPAIAAAGISALGSLLGGRGARKQAKQARLWALEDTAEQFVRLRDAATKAGFNPLTALQSGASGVPAQTLPALGSEAFLGDALSNGVQTWFNTKSAEAQMELDRIQAEAIQKEADALAAAQANPYGQAGFGFAPRFEPDPLAGQVMTSMPAMVAPEAPTGSGITYPKLDDPTAVMRNDGLTSANPDAPVEAEGDLWTWAREGTLIPNVSTVIDRNFYTPQERIRDAIKRGPPPTRPLNPLDRWWQSRQRAKPGTGPKPAWLP